MPKKPEIKNVLNDLLKQGFFSEWRSTTDVIKKLTARGLTIKSRKVGMIGRMLTKMCQDSSTGLERDEIPKAKRQGDDEWMYKQVK